MSSTEDSFAWIVNILHKHKIQFQISGGLAAKMYGATRPIADIDIEMSDDGFEKILLEVKEFVIFGPERYIDETFNVKLLTLEYKGQEIDLSGENGEKIFDKNSGKWVDNEIDFSTAVNMEVFGIEVPVISKEALIKYKSLIQRDVDWSDIKEISNS